MYLNAFTVYINLYTFCSVLNFWTIAETHWKQTKQQGKLKCINTVEYYIETKQKGGGKLFLFMQKYIVIHLKDYKISHRTTNEGHKT